MGMFHKVEEKQAFYEKLKNEWDTHILDDFIVCFGYFNGHVFRHIDGVHGVYGVGPRNLVGRMLLESCLDKELFLKNSL